MNSNETGLLQVIAGLRKHVTIDQLLNHLVVVILNLKPAKLAGKLSEAMILAAVHAQEDGTELVSPLQPPGESLLVFAGWLSTQALAPSHSVICGHANEKECPVIVCMSNTSKQPCTPCWL